MVTKVAITATKVSNGGDMHEITKGELFYQFDSAIQFEDPDIRDFLVDYIIQSWKKPNELGDLILIGTHGCGWDKLVGLMRLWCHPVVLVLQIPKLATIKAFQARPKVITAFEQDVPGIEANLAVRPCTHYVMVEQDSKHFISWKSVRGRFEHRKEMKWCLE
jgi:hypothetical protein